VSVSTGNDDAFFDAVTRGDLAAVKTILDLQPSLIWATTWGSQETGLHSAVTYGHLDIAKLLVERGADINAENAMHDTPLAYAFMFKQHEMHVWLESIGGETYS
jgi:ankyrin repeat protein